MITRIKKSLDPALPCSIQYRINSGMIAADHWVQDPETGGGRILGEVCHFIDTCIYLAGSKVRSVSAVAMKNSPQLDDTLVIQLAFENGSVASINYFSNGNKEVEKERLEVFASGSVYILDDFRNLTITGKNKSSMKSDQDKGHYAELQAFIHAVKNGLQSPISFSDLCHTTDITFKVQESVLNNGEQRIADGNH